jgi:hypothetical protein
LMISENLTGYIFTGLKHWKIGHLAHPKLLSVQREFTSFSDNKSS